MIKKSNYIYIDAVLSRPEQHRRFALHSTIAIIQNNVETSTPPSHGTHRHGINTIQIIKLRKQYEEDLPTTFTALDECVSFTELHAAHKQIRELQRILNNNTTIANILKEALEFG